MPLEWNGDRLRERVHQAAADAIDELVADAAADAIATHPWRNRTGNLEENIRAEPAHDHGDGHISGRFGYTYSAEKGHRSGFYGLFLEERDYPTLRPAADRHFPDLAETIRRKL